MKAQIETFADICRRTIEHAPWFYLLTDEHGSILDASHSACNLLGYEINDLTGNPVASFLSGSECNFREPMTENRCSIIKADGTSFKTRQGLIQKVHATFKKMDTAEGVFFSIFGSPADSLADPENLSVRINELTRMERTSQICSWSLDLVTKRESWSDESYRLLDTDPNARTISFQELFSKLSQGDVSALQKALTHCECTGTEQRVECTVSTGSGSRDMLCIIKLTRAADGNPIRLSGTLQDVSEQKNREKQLQGAKEKAEVESMTKSAFVANISHEIKTPVSAICGYVELVNDMKIRPASARRYLDTINKNASHLLDITNSLLDISKIEADRFDVQITEGDLAKTVDGAVALVGIKASEKNLDFRIRNQPGLPRRVATDHKLVRHILSNLLSNAFKYTDQGEIVLDISSDQDGAILQFSVTDTGCGMSEDQVAHLFTRFERFSSELSEPKEGLGLGLSIAKKMAEFLGGRIDVTSKPGIGSTFVFTCPVTVISEAAFCSKNAGMEASVARKHGVARVRKRILLAEDTKDIQHLYKTVLTRAGYEVDIADNGIDCLKKANAAASADRPFDLILMDIHMPRCGGFSAARKLRESGWRGQIVAITANPVTGRFSKKYSDAGYDCWYSKSMSTRSLVRLVEERLGDGKRCDFTH